MGLESRSPQRAVRISGRAISPLRRGRQTRSPVPRPGQVDTTCAIVGGFVAGRATNPLLFRSGNFRLSTHTSPPHKECA